MVSPVLALRMTVGLSLPWRIRTVTHLLPAGVGDGPEVEIILAAVHIEDRAGELVAAVDGLLDLNGGDVLPVHGQTQLVARPQVGEVHIPAVLGHGDAAADRVGDLLPVGEGHLQGVAAALLDDAVHGAGDG